MIEVTKEDVLRGEVASECSGSICGAVRYCAAIVPNANVILQLSGESHRTKTTRTNASGIFRFNDVKPGLYDLIVEANGFKPATIDSIGVQRGRHVTLPFVQLLLTAR